MIFRQQGEVWDYYKSTRLSTKVWAHWSVRVTSIGFLVFGLFSFFSYILPIGIRIIPAWIRIVGLGLMWVFFCLTIRATKRAQDKMYTREYASYRLDSSRDRRYLRYVLFLRKLADKKYTREDIAKLRQAVEIAEIPMPPGIQFNEHPLFWLLFIVPFATGLWNLGADFVKQADFWKGKQEAIATLSVFGVRILLSPERSQEAKSTFAPLVFLGMGAFLLFYLITFFSSWRGFLSLWSRKTNYQQLQRFLQWAEHDIEEEHFHRRQRLCEEMPGPHGPSH